MTYFWNSWYHAPEEMGNFKLEYPHWIIQDINRKNIEKVYAAIPYRGPPYDAINNPVTIIYTSYDRRPGRLQWIHKQIKQGSPFNEEFVKADWMKWPD